MIWSASDGGVGLTIEDNAKGRDITASFLISSDSLLTPRGHNMNPRGILEMRLTSP
jgi:hypothetical protein